MVTVNSITANIECGGCGTHFNVDIDTATEIPPYDDLMDLAEDFVRGGAMTSVQAGLALCVKCTSKVDSIGDDDYKPTDSEVIEKLNS